MSNIARVMCAFYIVSNSTFLMPAIAHIPQINQTSSGAIGEADTQSISEEVIEVKEAEIPLMPYGQVVANGARLREEPNYESKIHNLLYKGMVFDVIEKRDNFLKINYKGTEAFIDMSLVEQYQENPPYELYKEPIVKVASVVKSDGKAHFNPNNLREHSNLSVKQISTMLEGSALQPLASAYSKIEKEFNINAIFLMSLNSEETGHGRSKLAKSNNNLGGVKSRGGGYAQFASWEDSLRYIAKLLDTKYLTQGGSYYNGLSIWAVNEKYCEQKTWSQNLIDIAKMLMRRL